VGIPTRDVSPGPIYKIDMGMQKPCNKFAKDTKLKDAKTD